MLSWHITRAFLFQIFISEPVDVKQTLSKDGILWYGLVFDQEFLEPQQRTVLEDHRLQQILGLDMPDIIEQISIRKLLQWAAMPPTYADALDLVELGRDVDANGVKDPILIWVNIIERTIRLDSGNHRVYMMPLMGWTHLPCICRISNKSVGDPANGSHWYFSSDIKIPPYFREQYDEKPSLVIEGILD